MTFLAGLWLFAKDLLIGSIAAIISKTAVAPIERVKLLLQLQDGSEKIIENNKYKGVRDCFSRVYHEQGFFSFWRGNWANILRYFPTQAFNFAFKDLFKKAFLEGVDKKEQFWRFFAGNVASGSLAGGCTLFIVYPLDFARTRMATDIGRDESDREFTGLWDCLSKIFKSDGIFGLYRGFIVSLIGIVMYRGAYFGLYDTATGILPDEQNEWKKILISLVIAPITTAIASFIPYPLDTIRRRMMMQSGKIPDEKYRTWLHCAHHICKTEGFLGFYKGCWTNVLRGLGSSLVLVIYSALKDLIP